MGKKTKAYKELVRWLDAVSNTALACESRISPRGKSRELPPDAPTQSEAHAFRDGFVIGIQVASMLVEEVADGGKVPDKDPIDAYLKGITIWVERNCDIAGGDGR